MNIPSVDESLISIHESISHKQISSMVGDVNDVVELRIDSCPGIGNVLIIFDVTMEASISLEGGEDPLPSSFG